MDCSPPGSSVHGILQARILGWLAIPFSRASCWPRDQTWISCIAGRFFTLYELQQSPMMMEGANKPRNSCSLWAQSFSHVWLTHPFLTITHPCLTLTHIMTSPPGSLFVGFTRQEYWSGFLFSPPGDLLDLGIEPACLGAPALAGRFFTTEPVGKPLEARKDKKTEVPSVSGKECSYAKSFILS